MGQFVPENNLYDDYRMSKNSLSPIPRLIISRELTEEVWNVEEMMKVLDREVDAREQSFSMHGSGGQPRRPHSKKLHITATLMTSNSGPTHSAYCDQGHTSSSCTIVTDVKARKEVLHKTGRCYVCLRNYHIGKNCRPTTNSSRGVEEGTMLPSVNG